MAYTQRQYTESDAVKKFRENMEAHAPYESKWQPQINSTMDSSVNRYGHRVRYARYSLLE